MRQDRDNGDKNVYPLAEKSIEVINDWERRAGLPLTPKGSVIVTDKNKRGISTELPAKQNPPTQKKP